MALPHAQSGEVVSISPLGERLAQNTTAAIIKAAQLEVIRVVLPAGQNLRQHDTPGEITVQCLEGEAQFHAGASAHLLRAGDFLHLRPKAPHSITAVKDASLLVTICLAPG